MIRATFLGHINTWVIEDYSTIELGNVAAGEVNDTSVILNAQFPAETIALVIWAYEKSIDD